MKLTVSSSIVNYDFTDIKDFKDNDNKLLPNIILIQLESFINPNWITDIKFCDNKEIIKVNSRLFSFWINICSSTWWWNSKYRI